ncbi:fibroblast growth factor receptor-like 1 isoform X2 [Portunus trituberculatus]|uniref:fibroblast growth factor receptor-like 1 isoform X2 n=1 Tax=Portunus trituberculatus TaxID=210409 RepID=UPI001E1D07E1|nr:fibroblast growth factor receptor-like 1 isoform X2 [Portunus trituberculatus]
MEEEEEEEEESRIWEEEEEEEEEEKVKREVVLGPRGANQTPLTPEDQNNTVIVAQVGSTATIQCYTHYLPDEMVTWTKRDQDQLLTAGIQVYSSATRYSVAHVRHQKLWELSIRDVRLSDAGLYECQVTSHPPASLFFTLRVVEAKAVLEAGAEVHVHTGVKFRLQCTVQNATKPPDYIFWFHNDTMVNFAKHGRPIQVVQESLASTLLIANVSWADAGHYRCEPHLAHPANLTLHVVEGEKHAALHNGHSEEKEASPATATSSAQPRPFWLIIGCFCLITLRTKRMAADDWL